MADPIWHPYWVEPDASDGDSFGGVMVCAVGPEGEAELSIRHWKDVESDPVWVVYWARLEDVCTLPERARFIAGRSR